MDENFTILKISKLKSKKNNKEYYFVVIYSLKYEFDYKIFISKEIYDFLENTDYRNFNINNYLLKFYNKETNQFNYSLTSKDFLNRVTSAKSTGNK